ncbi:MAG: sigma-70 family RNA polymerase sigma factor, partial [Pseudomonadota bacterium]
MDLVPQNAHSVITRVVREEWGRVLSALMSFCRDLDLAEDALQEALLAALKSWPIDGVPKVPRAWLLATAKRRAIDRMRRSTNFDKKRDEYELLQALADAPEAGEADQPIPDERLKLVFTCCHPALPEEARIALTLRTVCGLSTSEIARAFLASEATMAQRLVRAKRKIRD